LSWPTISAIGLSGQLRFENGTIDVFKRGFKLCATQIGSIIGISGRLDSDRFVPTAGRDSPDAATTSLLGRIVALLEAIAVEMVVCIENLIRFDCVAESHNVSEWSR
jgi:hypothetical protein